MSADTQRLEHAAQAELRRRAWCQQKALAWLSLEASLERSFALALAHLRRRWPASTAGSEFEARAHQVWQRELAAAAQSTAAPRRLVAIRRMAGALDDVGAPA
jgi:hypothetical protein